MFISCFLSLQCFQSRIFCFVMCIRFGFFFVFQNSNYIEHYRLFFSRFIIITVVYTLDSNLNIFFLLL